MKDSDEWLYTVLADYSNDLAALKKRNGKLPAEAAIERIQAHYQPQAAGDELVEPLKVILRKYDATPNDVPADMFDREAAEIIRLFRKAAP